MDFYQAKNKQLKDLIEHELVLVVLLQVALSYFDLKACLHCMRSRGFQFLIWFYSEIFDEIL